MALALLFLSAQKGFKHFESKLPDEEKKRSPDAYVTPYELWNRCDWQFTAYPVLKGCDRLKVVDRNSRYPYYPSFDQETAANIIDPFRNLCYVCARYNWKTLLTRGWDQGMPLKYHTDRTATLGALPYPNPYRGIDLPVDYQLVNPHCALCGFLMKARESMGLTTECLAGSDNQQLQYYVSKTKQVVTLHMDGLFLKTLDDRSEQLLSAGQGDLRILKSFLRTCVSGHSHCKLRTRGRRLSLYKEPNLNLRVFDIRTNRVIPAPPNCRYVALSYVWGGHISFQLTQAHLMKPPGATSFSSAYAQIDQKALLPTIADAILFVQMMGERYIWIDQLCIVQDDPTEVANTVAAMNRIYGAALFTIIAADGDVTSGLPGVRRNSRNLCPVTASIDGVKLTIADPEVTSLRTSRWASRGWTYQEMELSARHFIFTRGRIYYQCKEMVRLENDPDRLFEQPKVESFGASHAGPRGFEEYAFHVERYSQRLFTYSSDVLRAFNGIQSDLSDRLGLEFCHGIPIATNPAVLMWSRPADSKPLQRRPDYPSWSWAGWMGPVSHQMPYNRAYHVSPSRSDWESALGDGILNIEGICYNLTLGDEVQGFTGADPPRAYNLDEEDWTTGSRFGILMTTDDHLSPEKPIWDFLIIRPGDDQSWIREGFISVVMDTEELIYVDWHEMSFMEVSEIHSADGILSCSEIARGIFRLR